MKKEDKAKYLLVIGFVLLLIIPLIWFPVNHLMIRMGWKNLVVSDNWNYYNSTGDKYIDLVESSKVSLENRVNNYFPFYNSLTSSFNSLNYNLNGLITSRDAIIGKNTDGELLKYNKNSEFYYVFSNKSHDKLEKRSKEIVEFFNNLVGYSDVNLYLYTTLRYEMTSMGDKEIYSYVKDFESNLNNDINFSYLETNSIEDYLKYFYKTDHHWNAYGALEGYKTIGEMMGFVPNNYEIRNMDIPYYGSFAKSVLSQNVVDTFSIIDEYTSLNITDISTCDTTAQYKPRIYEKKSNPFYDYYVGYYNGQYGHVTYSGNENSDRKLLIFSDSIAWQIDYLIAENFKETTVINLRYNEFSGREINYPKLIENNGITDVLFLYEGATLIFDLFDHKMHERITKW